MIEVTSFAGVDPARRDTLTGLALGVSLCAALAIFALSAAPLLNVPPMLAVLLLGAGVRAFAPQLVSRGEWGAKFCSKQILQISVAFLGFRVVAHDLLTLGEKPIVLIALSTSITVVSGYFLARFFRQRSDTAAISATSVAICGASAALAALAVAPQRSGLEREASVIIVAVSLLGSAAMLVYPWLASIEGFDQFQTSILLGGAIHDVAQVAGAGLIISPEVATHAVTVKMIRVACLLPVVMIFGWQLSRGGGGPSSQGKAPQLLPLFLVAFLAFVVIGSMGLVPSPLVSASQQLATWGLAMALAGIGLKISFAEIRTVPPNLFFVLLAQTLIQLVVVVFLIKLVFQFKPSLVG